MCKHYDAGLLCECRHERADRVLDKQAANSCRYFRPRPGAYTCSTSTQCDAARTALEALFVIGAAEKEQGSSHSSGLGSEAERARRELESLFGVTKKPKSERHTRSDTDLRSLSPMELPKAA